MKALLWILPFFLFYGPAMQAQEKKIKCDEAFNAFEQQVNAEDFDAAYKAMPELRTSCRGFNENIYRYGELIIKHKLERASAEEDKVLLNDLSALYTEYNKYYPKSDASIKKATLLYRNKLASDDEVYALLNAAFTHNKDAFTDPDAIEAYFILYLDKFKQGNDAITAYNLAEKYSAVSAQVRLASAKIKKQVEELLKKQASEQLSGGEKMALNNSQAVIETLAAVEENIEILALKYLNCKTLEEYYTANYDSNAENMAWLNAMVNTLVNTKCFTSDVAAKGASALHLLQPTSESAFNIAAIALRNNDSKKAIAYFEEAAELEPNQQKKADLYYRAASASRSFDRAASKKYALLAAQYNPANGKPYIFLAELYTSASADCDITPFEQKALMWLAIDTLKKAETAEAKFKPTVASMVKSYSERLPSKQEVKEAGRRKGDKITYGCWINETVIIPNLK